MNLFIHYIYDLFSIGLVYYYFYFDSLLFIAILANNHFVVIYEIICYNCTG